MSSWQPRHRSWKQRRLQALTIPDLPQVVLNYNGTSQELMAVSDRKLYWPLGYPPPDIPKCGFDNEDPACNQGDWPMLPKSCCQATASSQGARGSFPPDVTSLHLSSQRTSRQSPLLLSNTSLSSTTRTLPQTTFPPWRSWLWWAASLWLAF